MTKKNLMDSTCVVCGSMPRFKCGLRCAARYCGKECAKVYWKQHESLCIGNNVELVSKDGDSFTVTEEQIEKYSDVLRDWIADTNTEKKVLQTMDSTTLGRVVRIMQDEKVSSVLEDLGVSDYVRLLNALHFLNVPVLQSKEMYARYIFDDRTTEVYMYQMFMDSDDADKDDYDENREYPLQYYLENDKPIPTRLIPLVSRDAILQKKNTFEFLVPYEKVSWKAVPRKTTGETLVDIHPDIWKFSILPLSKRNDWKFLLSQTHPNMWHIVQSYVVISYKKKFPQQLGPFPSNVTFSIILNLDKTRKVLSENKGLSFARIALISVEEGNEIWRMKDAILEILCFVARKYGSIEALESLRPTGMKNVDGAALNKWKNQFYQQFLQSYPNANHETVIQTLHLMDLTLNTMLNMDVALKENFDKMDTIVREFVNNGYQAFNDRKMDKAFYYLSVQEFKRLVNTEL